ncbi:MAG: HlyD family secretion protein [Oceanobacter sp.]
MFESGLFQPASSSLSRHSTSKHLTPVLAILTSLVLTLTLPGCNLTDPIEDSSGRAMGTLERVPVVLMSPASLLITNQPVKEGDSVEAGQLIIQLDDREQQALVEQGRAQLSQAQSRLAELQHGPRQETLNIAKAQLDEANASLAERKRQLERIQTLFKQGQATQAEQDAAQTALNLARAQSISARQHWLELKAGTRSEQLDQAEATVASAQASLTAAEVRLDQLTIRAPVAGTLDALPWHLGERVAAGAQLAVLLQESAPYAQVYLPANRLPADPVGKSVRLNIDGVDHSVTGHIRYIRSQPAYTPYYALNERDRARLMYLAKIDFKDENLTLVSRIPSGRTLEVLLP